MRMLISGLRVLALILAGVTVSGCAHEVGASARDIAAVQYAAEEPPYVALITMVNTRTGKGAHSALLINASQRVIYDPAGTFQHHTLAERGDVHYGITDQALTFYKRYHARDAYFVHTQKVLVSPEVAEAVLRRTQQQGPSPKMFCTINTAEILQDIPQFSIIRPTLFPEKLRTQFSRVPGVEDSFLRENDHGKLIPTT